MALQPQTVLHGEPKIPTLTHVRVLLISLVGEHESTRVEFSVTTIKMAKRDFAAMICFAVFASLIF